MFFLFNDCRKVKVKLLFYAVSAAKARAPHLVAFYDTLGIRRTYSRLKPPASQRGNDCRNSTRKIMIA